VYAGDWDVRVAIAGEPVASFNRTTVAMQCNEGTYELAGVCLFCEEGMTCGTGTTLQTIVIDPGYWRLHDESREVIQCIRAGCKGSSGNATVGTTDDLCGEGYR
jgi:hypothetical protein